MSSAENGPVPEKNSSMPAQQTGLRQRSGEKRRLVLRAARQIFLRAGFAEASMDAISALSGVSKMTIYRHFNSKEDLFAGVISELCDKIIRLEPPLVTDDAPRKALSKYAERVIDTLFEPETLELHRVVIAECRRFPELGQLFFQRGPRGAIDALTLYLRKHGKSPAMRAGLDPERAAIEFLDLLRGYAHMKALLRIEAAPSKKEKSQRIAAALRHVLKDQ
jgi:TetR/AcrR family transcriptional repressor of mexJK operon